MPWPAAYASLRGKTNCGWKENPDQVEVLENSDQVEVLVVRWLKLHCAGNFQFAKENTEPFFLGWKRDLGFENWYKSEKGISLRTGGRVRRVIDEDGSDDAILEALGVKGRLILAMQSLAIDWFWGKRGNDLRKVLPSGVLKKIMVSLARTLVSTPYVEAARSQSDIRQRFVAGHETLGTSAGDKATSTIAWRAAQDRGNWWKDDDCSDSASENGKMVLVPCVPGRLACQ